MVKEHTLYYGTKVMLDGEYIEPDISNHIAVKNKEKGNFVFATHEKALAALHTYKKVKYVRDAKTGKITSIYTSPLLIETFEDHIFAILDNNVQGIRDMKPGYLYSFESANFEPDEQGNTSGAWYSPNPVPITNCCIERAPSIAELMKKYGVQLFTLTEGIDAKDFLQKFIGESVKSGKLRTLKLALSKGIISHENRRLGLSPINMSFDRPERCTYTQASSRSGAALGLGQIYY